MPYEFTPEIKAANIKRFEDEKDIHKRRLLFLDDTVAFYTSKNRAVTSEGICLYYATDSSPGCAIGRYISSDSSFNFSLKSNVKTCIIFHNLPDWMQEMGMAFLYEVQRLHDEGFEFPMFWDERGLNAVGVTTYEELKRNITKN